MINPPIEKPETTHRTSVPCLRKNPPTRLHERGFALIVTLSLMILLTVIAVGLLTLSSISLRASSQGEAMATARGNARLALMLAIGELQKSTGPDQRITATADIAGDATGLQLAAGVQPLNNSSISGVPKGLTSVQPGTRYWTGVWKNANATTPGSEIFTKTPSPQSIQWLVSGNEVTPNTVTPASPDYGLKTDGTVSDPKKAVVLAGGKTAGNKTTDPNYYVSAPLVAVNGTGASASKITGRYAWWVGDEGVKAKFNIVAPYSANELATYKNFSTQRSGWEVVPDFHKYPLPGTPESASLTGVISMGQASLLASPAPQTALFFHSATTDSYGIVTDTLQGGLRGDLTSYLRQTPPSTAASTIPNAIANNKNIIPSVVPSTTNLKGPKWNRLKDFSEMAGSLDGGSLKVKEAAAVTDYAIAPAIIDLRLLLGAKLVPNPAAADSFKVYPCAKVAVTLANPYSYPLKWEGLDLEIKNSMPGANIQMSRIWGSLNPRPAYIPKDTTEAAVFNNSIFKIPAGTLPPGGAITYTQTGPTVRTANSTAQVSIPLAPFSGPDAVNYRNSVILETTAAYSVAGNTQIALDVREVSVTSQIDAELRIKGSSAILRKLERLELDNAEFSPTQRKLGSVATNGAKLAKEFKEPIPLQLYSFQISQPGVDYGSLLPSTSDLGLRSSTMRTYADFNLQATRYRKPIISYNPPPYFMAMANSAAYLPFTAPGGETGSAFLNNLLITPLRWGRSISGSEKTVLFSPPASGEPIVSLAQFQHADLTADDIYASVGHQPGNACGNSYASPFLKRENVVQSRKDYQITTYDQATPTDTNYYDISYLLNAALWDTYFCSTIPATASTVPLNPKIVKLDQTDESADLRDGSKAAARLLVNGAFNINSTSKDAWKAFLAGTKHLKHPADTSPSNDALYARSLAQSSPGKTPPTGESEDSFAGFRRLSDTQIDALADEITKQVRLRGPFVSLSQFVNRALVPLTTNKDLGRCGTLQSAIDLSGLNIKPDGSQGIFQNVTIAEDRVALKTMSSSSSLPAADMPPLPTSPAGSNFQPSNLWPTSSRDKNPGAVASILADKEMLTDATYRPEQGFRSTGIPGWLTQADVLQVIGPSISARSDTFKVRAYGEALDPGGKVIAKAWCEATVQRVPQYVDPADLATERDTDLAATNKTFGRRYNIVSFRWLSPNEI